MDLTLTINLPILTALVVMIGFLWRLTMQVAMALKEIMPLKEGHVALLAWQHRQDRALQRLEFHAGLDPMYDGMKD